MSSAVAYKAMIVPDISHLNINFVNFKSGRTIKYVLLDFQYNMLVC